MARLVRAIHVEPLPEFFRRCVKGMQHKMNALLLHSFVIAFIILPDSSGLDRAIFPQQAIRFSNCLTHAQDGPVKPCHDDCVWNGECAVAYRSIAFCAAAIADLG